MATFEATYTNREVRIFTISISPFGMNEEAMWISALNEALRICREEWAGKTWVGLDTLEAIAY